jgi:hypothetical protein
VRLRLEQLEDRTLPSNFFAATVSDLIADINLANKDGGTDTITLTAPTTSPYVLTAVDNNADGANGLPVIKKALTIVGNGDTIERSTASGTPDFRLFDVANGGSLTLQNLTQQNGLAFGWGSAAEGGAIYNQGALVLSGATIQANSAIGSNGAPGVGFNKDGGSGRDAAGGGIWSNGSLTLENGSQILFNLAVGGNGGQGIGPIQCNKFANGGNASGGGVYVAGGTADLLNANMSNNVALGGQPGFNVVDGFQDSATGNGGRALGGALDVAAGTVSLTGVLVNGNAADGGSTPYFNGFFPCQSFPPPPNAYGGGIYVGGGTLTLCNDIAENNMALGGYPTGRGFGGGIYIVSGATVYIDSFTVAHTINNTDISGLNGSTANIGGTYTLKNC